MMYTITFPESRAFTGTYLTVPFAQGVGQTDDDYLAERFRKKGLLVEKEKVSTSEKPKRATKQVDAS